MRWIIPKDVVDRLLELRCDKDKFVDASELIEESALGYYKHTGCEIRDCVIYDGNEDFIMNKMPILQKDKQRCFRCDSYNMRLYGVETHIGRGRITRCHYVCDDCGTCHVIGYSKIN